MAEVGQLEAALDLLRRLPPQQIEQNLEVITKLLPDETPRLLKMVDVPSNVMLCPSSQREFLLCDHNRHDMAYRSPWSNKYCYYGENGAVLECEEESGRLMPSESLRRLEQVANEAFSTYRNLYYEGGVSSVYLWDVNRSTATSETNPNTSSGPASFGAVILIKKAAESGENLKGGCWDSVHVIEVDHLSGNKYSYKLTTTVILHLDAAIANLDEFCLSGSVTRQIEQQHAVPSVLSHHEDHVIFMGRMVEEMESRMRSSLQEIYFGKTHDVINEIRPIVPAGFLRHQADLAVDLQDPSQQEQQDGGEGKPSRRYQAAGPGSLLAAAAVTGLANLRKTKKTDNHAEDTNSTAAVAIEINKMEEDGIGVGAETIEEGTSDHVEEGADETNA